MILQQEDSSKYSSSDYEERIYVSSEGVEMLEKVHHIIPKKYLKIGWSIRAWEMPNMFIVKVNTGQEVTAEKGDFLAEGINGEVYPIKRDIFLKTYVEDKTIIHDNKTKYHDKIKYKRQAD